MSFPFEDATLDPVDRAHDLVGRLTLEEKIGFMSQDAKAIPRLGVPAYNWWNECLHGVARAGTATVFPQALSLAAMWDEPFLHRLAGTISDEARAKHHESARRGDRGNYKGLTFWAPNINIYRDPRWGRGHETYGEDPFLTGRLGVAFVKGLQGDDPHYLKVAATPKHFAVHSGPEASRQWFDSLVSPKDLWETYLPAFEACVVEGQAASVMGAYNRLNGVPCCADEWLLNEVLRKRWGFKGYVVSDCGAVEWMQEFHKSHATRPAAAAAAVKAGCDLCCGSAYETLLEAVNQGLIAETDLDVGVRRLFTTLFRLGSFDAVESVPFSKISFDVVDSTPHREMALQASREALVLLKNNGLLPLKKELGTVAVLGPNADCVEALLGNYAGTPGKTITPLRGLRERLEPRTRVLYANGCAHADAETTGMAEALACASRADAVIVVLGNSPRLEGEAGDAFNSDMGGDRQSLGFPGLQQALLEQVVALGKPTVLVVLSGGPISMPWAHDNLDAILWAGYPGQEGGTAVAEALFGDFSPAGRLPMTFVRSLQDLPEFGDYSMQGRTYRFMEQEPLYPFGYGLSYTDFEYRDLVVAVDGAGAGLTVRATLRNTGAMSGAEVVQVYLRRLDGSADAPKRWLAGFKRLSLKSGEECPVEFNLTPRQLALVNSEGRAMLKAGTYEISIGSGQPDKRSIELKGKAPLLAEIRWAYEGEF